MRYNDVVIGPVLTEKSTKLAQKQVYLFFVNLKANKYQIRNSLQNMFQVTVGDVKTMIRGGKTRRVGRKLRTIQKPERKIAYVTVTKGAIDIFPKP